MEIALICLALIAAPFVAIFALATVANLLGLLVTVPLNVVAWARYFTGRALRRG